MNCLGLKSIIISERLRNYPEKNWTMLIAVRSALSYISKVITISILLLVIADFSLLGVEYAGRFRGSAFPCPDYWSRDQARKVVTPYLEVEKKFENAYVPFSLWGYREYHSKIVNIERTGDLYIRRTHFNTPKPKFRIWMFGASAVFGNFSESDRSTIPSILSREFNSRGLNVQILNFGIAGYSSTQETILLSQLLKSNLPKPDLAIFYDGYNDFYLIHQAEKYNFNADYHQNYPFIKDLFERPLSAWIGKTLLYKNVMKVVWFFQNTVARRQSAQESKNSGKDLRRLLKKQISAYETNMVMVDALASHYKFKALHFVQPTLIHKKKKTRYELWLTKKTPIKYMTSYLSNAYDLFENHFRNRRQRPISLTDCFVNEKQNIFIDVVHHPAVGNEKVARAMLRYINMPKPPKPRLTFGSKLH